MTLAKLFTLMVPPTVFSGEDVVNSFTIRVSMVGDMSEKVQQVAERMFLLYWYVKP